MKFSRFAVFTSALFLVFANVSVRAAGSATVDLGDATFGKGLDVHLGSGTTLLYAASSYRYNVTGTLHGTGLLSAILPNGTQLSTLLDTIQAGSSSVLSGTISNPGGTLPVTVINRTFSGSVPIGIFTATAKVTILGRVAPTGQVRFHVTNVDFNVPGYPDLGTVVFEPGSKLVVSVVPVIEFAVAAKSVAENVGTLMVRVRRRLNPAGSVTVHYSSAPNTATGSDFTAVSGDLTFAAGEVTKTFPVAIKNRPGVQGSRAFRLRLSPPTGGVLGLISRETVTITDVP